MMCFFPNSCLRGIANDNFVVQDNGCIYAAPHLFTENQRKDNSINWEDDENVLEFTLNQNKSNGKRQFNYGVARLKRHSIDEKKKDPKIANVLSYDREPLDDNKYHGNITINSDNSTIRKMIASALAIECEIIPRNKI